MADTTQAQAESSTKMVAFEQAIMHCRMVEVTATFSLKTGSEERYGVTFVPFTNFVRAYCVGKRKTITQRTMSQAWQVITNDVLLDCITSLKVKATGGGVVNKDLKPLAIEACCEALGLTVPSAKGMAQAAKTSKQAKEDRRKQLREDLLADLRDGAQGLKRWRTKVSEQHELSNLRNCDLHGLNLDGVRLTDIMDVTESNFDDCNLDNADLSSCIVRECTFRKASMAGARLNGCDGVLADFSGADLSNASFRWGNFRRAIFAGANLHGANFDNVDLSGADLQTADLTNVNFEKTKYDEETLWTAGFVPPDGLIYSGKGKDPFLIEKVKALAGGNVDFNDFVTRLEKGIDQERLKKALKMLKAESFQLFAEVKSDSMVGVVKSQTDPDLVYSCRLQDSGNFSCCTQNLHPCGGLRGSLCKHLLVLLIGLTKAAELDPVNACAWVMASASKKPVIDKDIMTATFLRYKGAEAGEVDWRPTETMPEDYYAY